MLLEQTNTLLEEDALYSRPLALGLTSLGARTAYRTEAFSFQSRAFTLHFLYLGLFRIGESVLSVLHLTLIFKAVNLPSAFTFTSHPVSLNYPALIPRPRFFPTFIFLRAQSQYTR